MSTIPKRTDQAAAGRNRDAFRYGWRDVQRKDERGRMVWDQQPLTLDDVLHPQMGDVILGNEDHLLDVTYLFTVLQAWLANLVDVVVLSDVGIYWDIPKLRNHSPDVMIIRGVQHDKPYTTFDVAKEGARPEWIIEVTSSGTHSWTWCASAATISWPGCHGTPLSTARACTVSGRYGCSATAVAAGLTGRAAGQSGSFAPGILGPVAGA